jgi:uncharacterized protein DUF3574
MTRYGLHCCLVAVLAIVLNACATSAHRAPQGVPTSLLSDSDRLVPRQLSIPDIRLTRRNDAPAPKGPKGPKGTTGTLMTMKRLFMKGVTPMAVTIGMLAAAPVQALQQIEAQRQDRPIVRRRAPDGQRRGALAFVRTELYFGTAKPVGAVTEAEFKKFLDDVVTPFFPDGLTVIKGDGQFKGEDGLTIKEESFVLILLYPVDGHKTSSRNIDAIRQAYMTQHQQESVLRVDDPFLVWVSF